MIGWLAELFPCLYCHRPDSDCRSHVLTLVRYPRLLGRKLSLPQARHVFGDGGYLSLRASSYQEESHNGRDVIGAELLLEPYYPNRFAHQFGLDQGVLSNRLSFIRALREQRSIMDLAQAHADLQW